MLDLRPQSTESTEARAHETMDITLNGILVFAGVLIFTSVAVFVSMRLLVGVFQRDELRDSIVDRPPLFSKEGGLYPGPNLQENPAVDLVDKKNDEIRRLTTPSDKIENGTVRIPIDRAIEIVAKQAATAQPSAAPRQKADEPKGNP